jgi:VanZ family protein
MIHRLPAFAAQLARWTFLPALAVVVWGELKPSSPGPELVWDKLLHFTAYFGLAGIATAALGGRLRAVLWTALALAVFGGILEIVQGSVGRDAEWGDELANIVGVCAGTAAAGIILRFLTEASRRGECACSMNSKNLRYAATSSIWPSVW